MVISISLGCFNDLKSCYMLMPGSEFSTSRDRAIIIINIATIVTTTATTLRSEWWDSRCIKWSLTPPVSSCLFTCPTLFAVEFSSSGINKLRMRGLTRGKHEKHLPLLHSCSRETTTTRSVLCWQGQFLHWHVPWFSPDEAVRVGAWTNWAGCVSIVLMDRGGEAMSGGQEEHAPAPHFELCHLPHHAPCSRSSALQIAWLCFSERHRKIITTFSHQQFQLGSMAGKLNLCWKWKLVSRMISFLIICIFLQVPECFLQSSVLL